MVKKRILLSLLTITLLMGNVITVSANKIMPRNNWCHEAAADPLFDEGWHEHDGKSWHYYKRYQCAACGAFKSDCYY